jgi:isopenicillin N synthase-like dioxygenase
MWNRFVLIVLVLQAIYILSSYGVDDIPIIDISEFYSGDEEIRRAVANKIGDASRNVGFFVVTGYKIDQAVIDSTCM